MVCGARSRVPVKYRYGAHGWYKVVSESKKEDQDACAICDRKKDPSFLCIDASCKTQTEMVKESDDETHRDITSAVENQGTLIIIAKDAQNKKATPYRYCHRHHEPGAVHW